MLSRIRRTREARWLQTLQKRDTPSSMTTTLEIDFPATLRLHAKDTAALNERSRFLLALKFFELGELSSGQAAQMCGLGRVQFLDAAARCGVPATELTGDELNQEFGDA